MSLDLKIKPLFEEKDSAEVNFHNLNKRGGPNLNRL